MSLPKNVVSSVRDAVGSTTCAELANVTHPLRALLATYGYRVSLEGERLLKGYPSRTPVSMLLMAYGQRLVEKDATIVDPKPFDLEKANVNLD